MFIAGARLLELNLFLLEAVELWPDAHPKPELAQGREEGDVDEKHVAVEGGGGVTRIDGH